MLSSSNFRLQKNTNRNFLRLVLSMRKFLSSKVFCPNCPTNILITNRGVRKGKQSVRLTNYKYYDRGQQSYPALFFPPVQVFWPSLSLPWSAWRNIVLLASESSRPPSRTEGTRRTVSHKYMAVTLPRVWPIRSPIQKSIRIVSYIFFALERA